MLRNIEKNKIHLLVLGMFLLLTTMSFAQRKKEIIEIPWKNGKLIISDNKRFIQHENGVPFFWMGQTSWLLPSRLNREEVDFFMDKIRKHGFNVIQISVFHTYPAVNVYGDFAFPKTKFVFEENHNSGIYDYWKHVDYIVETAVKNGIYAAIVCIWGGNAKVNMNMEEAGKYGKFLAERYKKYPNIIWLIGGDARTDEKTEIWKALAISIKSVDPDHLMTFHPFGRTSSVTSLKDESWMDINMFQSGHRRYGQALGDGDYSLKENTEEDNWRYVEQAMNIQPLKPILDGEPSYEEIPQGLHDPSEPYWQPEDVRRYAYWSVFAGACGHTYGHNSSMQIYRPGYLPAYGAHTAWWDALDAPGYIQMKYLKNLILAFPFFNRISDQSIVTGTNGTQYDRVIVTRGDDYFLAYNYTNRPAEYDLTKISGSQKKAWWYSPTDGGLEYIGEFESRKQTFVYNNDYRAGNDRVLIVVDARRDYASKIYKENEMGR